MEKKGYNHHILSDDYNYFPFEKSTNIRPLIYLNDSDEGITIFNFSIYEDTTKDYGIEFSARDSNVFDYIHITEKDDKYQYDTLENEKYMIDTYSLSADDIMEKVDYSKTEFEKDFEYMMRNAKIFFIGKSVLLFTLTIVSYIFAIVYWKRKLGVIPNSV